MNSKVQNWLLRLTPVVLVVALYYLIPGFKEEANTAAGILAKADIEGMKQYILSFGIWGPIVSMGLMILQAIAAPLPAFVITFANAWIFGWAWGAFYSWTGAMIAAMICFYISKGFGRPVVEKMVGKTSLDFADRFFDKYGYHSVMIARLIPVVSFDLVSYAAGFTSMRLWHFVWATGLGQLPATIVYSILGENMTSGVKYGLWVFTGVVALLVLSMALKKRLTDSLQVKENVN